MPKGKLLLAVLLAVLLGSVWFLADPGRYLTLEALKANQAAFNDYNNAYPWRTAAAFAGLYILVTGLSVPGTMLLTVSAGAIFGLVKGVVLVSFSSAIGATVAFLSSRYLLRDWVLKRFGSQLDAFNRGVERDGAYYVVSLGLIPIFPYFVINLVMGLTPMRVFTFYWASQAGMLIETILVVNAGTQLAQVESLSGLLSPTVLASLAVIGLVPLLLRRLLGASAKARP